MGPICFMHSIIIISNSRTLALGLLQRDIYKIVTRDLTVQRTGAEYREREQNLNKYHNLIITL